MISVIVPVYNGEQTIRKCLSSILSQHYPKNKMEVIVIDNNSSDKTAVFIKQYNVRYFHEKTRGVSRARNTGIMEARGDILLFIDADCTAFPDLLYEHARAHLYFNKHRLPVKAVGGGIEGENKTYWAVCDDFFSWFLFNPGLKPGFAAFHTTANFSISRDILPVIDYFDESLDYAEDFVFCSGITKQGFQIYFHPFAKAKHMNRLSLKAAMRHARNWAKTQFNIRVKGYVNRDFLKNELHIIFYYFFYYIHRQFFGMLRYILSSRRYHVIFYFPFIILIGMQYLSEELQHELRYCRYKKLLSKKREKKLHVRKLLTSLSRVYNSFKRLHGKKINNFLVNTESLTKYIKYLLTGKASAPREIVLDPINICNLRCPLCPTGLKKLDFPKTRMDFETLASLTDRIVKDFPFLNLIHLFSWGEVFLHPDIFAIIRYLKQREFIIYIDTNFCFHRDTMFFQSLAESGIDVLTVSIDGASRESYAAYRRGGDYSLALSNLRLAVETRNRLKIKTQEIIWKYIVHKYNEHEINIARKRAAEIGVTLQLVPIGLGEVLPDIEFPDSLESRKSGWLPAQEKYINPVYLPYSRRSASRPGLRFCPFPFKTLVICPDGKVVPCPVITSESNAFGDIKKETLKQIWHNDYFEHSRKIFTGKRKVYGNRHIICDRCKNFI
ncbi:MAG: glycosyltransferase [Spirochaetales bacterium]|nr:glycosyltransferase [Spirochaetales bacterium]